MTWDEHWAVLLSGAVASTISLIGLFAVFWLTTRHDRRRDEQRRDAEERAITRATRAADVSRIHMSLAMQAKDMTLAPLYGNAQALELLAACMSFATSQGVQHPAVASWVVQQHSRAHRARQAYWWVSWIPLIRNKRAGRWGEELAILGSSLMQWQLGTRSDQWFESQLEPVA
jgi:hypothetical protein